MQLIAALNFGPPRALSLRVAVRMLLRLAWCLRARLRNCGGKGILRSV